MLLHLYRKHKTQIQDTVKMVYFYYIYVITNCVETNNFCSKCFTTVVQTQNLDGYLIQTVAEEIKTKYQINTKKRLQQHPNIKAKKKSIQQEGS